MTTHNSDLENQTALVTGATSASAGRLPPSWPGKVPRSLSMAGTLSAGAMTVEAITAAGGQARFVEAGA
jgi:hypothetical protein